MKTKANMKKTPTTPSEVLVDKQYDRRFLYPYGTSGAAHVEYSVSKIKSDTDFVWGEFKFCDGTNTAEFGVSAHAGRALFDDDGPEDIAERNDDEIYALNELVKSVTDFRDAYVKAYEAFLIVNKVNKA